MKWYEDLFVGERVKEHAQQIREKMEAGEDPGHVWVIMPAANGKDLFDIRRASDLHKEYFRGKDPLIIGLAKNRDEAIMMIPQILAKQAGVD